MILALLLILPSFTWANGLIGPENPNKNISRDEMAVVAVRLLGMEGLKDDYNKKGKFKDVDGWALPFVNIASENNIMMGKSKDAFGPKANLSYIEVLTVMMRILGYEDGIDFVNYPLDYYNKAMEIGLGDLYIGDKELISRSVVSETIDRALTLNIKDSNLSLGDKLARSPSKAPLVDKDLDKNISLDKLVFNKSILGIFSGELKGASDFTNYKLELLSKSGDIYGSETLSKSGDFKITGFDIDLMSKLSGYMYKLYDAKGNIVLSSDLK